MEIRSSATLSFREDRTAIADRIKSTPVDLENVRAPTKVGSVPDKIAAQRQAAVAAKGQVHAAMDNWGYLGALRADGGQARIDAFHNRLNDYLKTTQLWPSEVDKKV